MKYFGTKRVAEVDADAVAAERLMSIAGRFKMNEQHDDVSSDVASSQEQPTPDMPD